MTCNHKNLMRHDYHGKTWWQCEEGCDFLFRGQPMTGDGKQQEALHKVNEYGGNWESHAAEVALGQPSHASGEPDDLWDRANQIALKAIEKEWSAKVLGSYIAGMAIEHGRVEFQRGYRAGKETK